MRRRRKVRFAFRILGLTQKQIQLLKSEVKAAKNASVSKLREDPAVSTVVFGLRSGASYKDLIRFLEVHQIKKSCRGIWISFTSSRDIDGVHVPKYVVKLYEKSGGDLDFSCVWLSYET